jgi:hypothetical protein
MLDFTIFLLATIGLTMIITQSYIFKPIRENIQKISPFLGKLLHCPMCFGFWSGILIKTSLLIFYQQFVLLSLIIIVLYGFIGSFMSYLTYLLIKPLMDKYD